MKEIWSLSGEIVALVDDEDFERVAKFNWSIKLQKKSGSFRVTRSVRTGNRQSEYLPLCNFVIDCPDGFIVTHANGDKADFRKENLLVMSRDDFKRYNLEIAKIKRLSGGFSERVARTKRLNAPRGEFKGVDFDKREHRYRARISIAGKRSNLSWFATAVEAAESYDAAAFAAWGADCYLNFPEAFGLPARMVSA